MSRVTAAPIVLSMVLSTVAPPAHAVEYPSTKRVDHADSHHGQSVPDPYRWLEDDVRTSSDVHQWVEAQNRVTFGYLESLPFRKAIATRVSELWNYEKYQTPFKRGGRYYYFKNEGLQNQYVLYVTRSLAEPARVLIDPNKWSADGTVALSGTAFSEDGRYVAYGQAASGSDWVTWRVMEIESGKILEDEIRWVKFSGVDWTHDGKGFFYATYPAPKEGAAHQSLNHDMKLFYHRVGTPQSADVVVWYEREHPDWGYAGSVTEDGRYLVITVWKGTARRHRILVKDLQEPYAAPAVLVNEFENEYSFIGNDGPTFYFQTDFQAPRRRLIAVDLRKPAKDEWRDVVPQAKSAIEDASYIGGHFVVQYLEDAKSVVQIFAADGRRVRDVPLAGIGSTQGFGGRHDDPETFYTFQSFATPPTIYRYDVRTGEGRVVFQSNVAFDPRDYVVKQVFATSKDGTRVPLFISHRKGLKLDGNTPTLLYGYGGFNISMTPLYSNSRMVWMQMGGVSVIANLRGGGEYGEEWHEAGTKLKKQNVFDDFIAAAEWLTKNKYTRPSKLAIQGGSNGGLLVGAALTQRPDLFGAALPAVGVMDMLRFHKFTAGRFWVDDYGSAENADEFKALLAYSPYHNLRKGTKYPATLVTTADTDDRVVPGHSFKFAAALQEAQAGPAPVMIRIETKAGHGAGKPTAKIIEEVADQWAFAAHNLGLKPPADFLRPLPRQDPARAIPPRD
jgi:prolyl oligopeptidase